MGPVYPQVFPVQAFAMEAVEPFMKAVRTIVSDDPESISRALVALLVRIGPAVLVAHSNSGLWGWLTAARSPLVRAVVSYEPSFVYPPGEALPEHFMFQDRNNVEVADQLSQFLARHGLDAR